jgi:hypothetical protein
METSTSPRPRATLPPDGIAPPAPASAQRYPRWGERVRSMCFGILAAAVLIALIAAGSRGFHWFDAALIGYAVGTIFAVAAVTYKYTFWLSRPQTGRYFWRSWRLFFSVANFRRYTTLIPRAIFADLLTQQFILRRRGGGTHGLYRWITHQCIFWGVVLSCLITFPLTFGWLRFTQTPSGEYHIWVFGFPLFTFIAYSPIGFFFFHALLWTSLLLLVGLVMALHRRFHDLAQIAIQRVGFDIMPLALLFAITISGLALIADSHYFGGEYYWFISLVHEAVVVFWLISLPFGKFFHIIERPATVGIELYWRTGGDSEPQRCPRCGEPFAPARFIADLKRTAFDIGQDYAVDSRAQRAAPAFDREAATGAIWWQDFCPECKRIMRGQANLTALGREGNQFL